MDGKQHAACVLSSKDDCGVLFVWSSWSLDYGHANAWMLKRPVAATDGFFRTP